MKKIFYSLFLLSSLVVSVSSCTSTLKVTSEYDKNADFSKYKTFSIYHLQTVGNISEANADRIYKAIKSEMASKGLTFKEATEEADVLVNAVSVVQDKVETTQYTTYYGYGGLYRPYAYWGGPVVANSTYDSRTYKSGTFTIDVVDNKTNKMVWQGIGKAEEIDPAPNSPQDRINGGVAKILASYPPKK